MIALVFTIACLVRALYKSCWTRYIVFTPFFCCICGSSRRSGSVFDSRGSSSGGGRRGGCGSGSRSDDDATLADPAHAWAFSS